MIVQDNVLKEYLKNVYFITGTPCGGKTTISRALGDKYGFHIYDVDEEFLRHKQISTPDRQPAMNTEFPNADTFFGRTVDEYRAWLLANTREQLDFILLDLIRLSQAAPVLCDCHLTIEEAECLTDPKRIVFLIKEPSRLVDDYCNRPDHQGFRDFLYRATDVEAAKNTCNTTLQSINTKRYTEIKNSNYFWLERTDNSTVADTLSQVERYFGLVKE